MKKGAKREEEEHLRGEGSLQFNLEPICRVYQGREGGCRRDLRRGGREGWREGGMEKNGRVRSIGRDVEWRETTRTRNVNAYTMKSSCAYFLTLSNATLVHTQPHTTSLALHTHVHSCYNSMLSSI